MSTPPPAPRHRGPSVTVVAMALTALIALAGCGTVSGSGAPSGPSEIRVGAVFPLTGNAAGLAGQTLDGLRAAVDFANTDGGIAGRRIVLDVHDLQSAADAPAAMADLKAHGDAVVVGAYSSELSIPASQAASDAGLVYWEAGAVADQLTGRGLPLVFRVGASGANLGSNSARFAVDELASRLGKSVGDLRIAIVAAQDDYAESVAAAATSTASAAGAPIVANLTYSLSLPGWPDLMANLAAASPDVIILASHIPDGVAFRQAMLTAGLHVGALIGSTMAECDPDFAGDLGADAIGIFASDRPTGGFQPSALDAAARAVYDRFAAAWQARPTASSADSGIDGSGGAYGNSYGNGDGYGYGTPGPSASDGYGISGPIEEGSANAGPTEEGLSGFAAGWALFHDVLPAAGRTGQTLDPTTIAAAARSVDLPMGSLPNGAGLHFSNDPATLGQNELAAAVIWQWQAVRSYTFVWPNTYQTGQIEFVPLAR